MIPALYGIAARHIVTDELLRCDSVSDLLDLAPLLEEYASAFAEKSGVVIDLDTTPTS